MTLVERRVTNPFRGTQEFLINAGLERDGIGQRICLHVDCTWQDTEEGAVLRCDYCPAEAPVGPGLRAVELPAWYWPVEA